MAIEPSHTIVEWPSEKKSPAAAGRLPLLHELSRDVIDRRDMVGVHRVAETEGVGEEGRPELQGIAAKSKQGPAPSSNIGNRHDAVEDCNSPSYTPLGLSAKNFKGKRALSLVIFHRGSLVTLISGIFSGALKARSINVRHLG